MKTLRTVFVSVVVVCGLVLFGAAARGQGAQNYDIYVSNERSDNVSVIDAATRQMVATIPVGKRPRGIHVSPDGKTVYVAVSGTPPEPPPKLDANGNPIFQKGHDDDDDDKNSDKSADGIAVIDVAQRKLVGKLRFYGFGPRNNSPSARTASGFLSPTRMLAPPACSTSPAARWKKSSPSIRSRKASASGPMAKSFTSLAKPTGKFSPSMLPPSKSSPISTCGRTIAAVRLIFCRTVRARLFPRNRAGQIHVIDTASYQPLETVLLAKGSRPMCVKVSPDGKKVYLRRTKGRAGTVCVLDADSHKVLNAIKAGTRPWGIIISPDGKFLYSANGPSNDISGNRSLIWQRRRKCSASRRRQSLGDCAGSKSVGKPLQLIDRYSSVAPFCMDAPGPKRRNKSIAICGAAR